MNGQRREVVASCSKSVQRPMATGWQIQLPSGMLCTECRRAMNLRAFSTHSDFNSEGPPHMPTFHCNVYVDNKEVANAAGPFKKTAKQE